MKKFNFHLFHNTRQLIIAIVIAVAGIAMFTESYELFMPSSNANQPAVPSGVYGGIDNQSKKIVEAHWQGMEIVPLTWELAAKLGIPLNEKGVLIDEVTLAAADSGLMARDIVKSINGSKITNLDEFYIATKRLKNQKRASIELKRGNKNMTVDLIVPDELGFAQLESAPMVLAGSIAPHRYRGPCTDCHAIGSGGQLTPDPDAITLVPPPISKQTKSPHRNRGKCKNCHIVK